jgi:hypothetical protein
LAEVVGKWIWLDVSPAQKPGLANLLWAFIGTSGVVSGSTRAASLTRSAVIPPTRAPSIVAVSPLMFCRPNPMIAMTKQTLALSVKAAANSRKFWRFNPNSL